MEVMILISFARSFCTIYYIKMGKNTRKVAAPRKPKTTLVKLSSADLKDLTKTKMIRKALRTS